MSTRSRAWALALLAAALCFAAVADASVLPAAEPAEGYSDAYARPVAPEAPAPQALPFQASAEAGPAAPLPSIVSGVAPLPTLIDGDGRSVAPAACNQGTASSANVPGIQFCCPKTLAPFGTSAEGVEGDRYDYRECPFRIYDTQGVGSASFRFGNPQVAVNPSDEREVAFCSLHGDATQGPTPRSRVQGESQTTFTSHDQGVTWEDQPPFDTPGLGESATCTMDAAGNMYVGYLYSSATGNATTGYGSALWLIKAGTTHDTGTVRQAYSGGDILRGRTPMNPIPALNVIDVPAYRPAPPAAATNASYGPPANASEVGDYAVPHANATDERVGAVWFERCTEYYRGKDNACDASNGMPGWIDAAFTSTAADDGWHRLNATQLIGPCMDASNPVQFDGQVYVACAIDKGYDARSRARIGDIDIWRIDPLTGKTELVESTFVSGGHPLLASTRDGYMVMVTTKHDGATGAHVFAAFGWYGRAWTALGTDLGPQLHRMAGSRAVKDAGINALSISETEKTAILEYMEWSPSNVTSVPVPTIPDPSNPQVPSPQLKDFTKILTTFNSCSFPIAAARMELGTGIDPDNLDAYAEQPSIFDDNQDGLLSYTEPGGGDLFYFAVNDYGAMQYGAVLTSASSNLCIPAPPPPPVPPLPVPQALTVSNAAVTTVGSVLGIASAAAIVYLVTAKRRNLHLAVVEAK